MDINVYVFLTRKIEFAVAPSVLIQSLVYAEDALNVEGYQFMAFSPSAIHGLVLWDAFKTKPLSQEAVRAKAERLWDNRDSIMREKLIENDMKEYQHECELFENEPMRWKNFIENILIEKKSEKVGVLFSDQSLDFKNLKMEACKSADLNEVFFRDIKKNILYTVK